MSIGGGTTQHTHSGAGQGGTSLPSHVPPGAIMAFGHANDPGASVGDWLECNGQNVSRDTYANLFAKIGVTWGAGDGVSTFTLPDARRRSPVGAGGTGTATLAATVGSTGGEEAHLNTSAESGTEAHAHRQQMPNSAGNGVEAASYNIGGAAAVHVQQASSATGNSTAALNTQNAAASSAASAHNTYHPVLVCGVWIKT